MKVVSTVPLLAACLVPMGCLLADNVALNKTVTLEGSFFTGGWGGGTAGSAASVVDGIFLPVSHQWDQGTVWWDSGMQGASDNHVVVNLGGDYSINGLILQADDNDAYLVEYYDSASLSWLPAWMAPPAGGWGMQVRPDLNNPSAIYTLPAAITTSALRVSGVNGDGLYSVSEIQAFTHATPDGGATLAFVGLSSLALAAISRRSRN